MYKPALALIALLCPLVARSHAAITVTTPTSGWTPVMYGSLPSNDPGSDHQSKGSLEGDIVGDATHASFYVGFDDGGTADRTDGHLAFRLRVAGDSNPNGFNSVFWVGMDVNGDGALDVFAGASGSSVGIYSAGSGNNVSPSTTTINTSWNKRYEVPVTAANFDFSKVTATSDPSATSFNLDGGTSKSGDQNDYFVSFVVPFSKLVGAVEDLGLGPFDDSMPMRYVVATANQKNSLNQDLNGIDGGVGSDQTWTSLGGFSSPYLPKGTPFTGNQTVPEPGVSLLAVLGGILIWRRNRR